MFMDSYFWLFIRLLSAFLLFYVKMQTKQDQIVLYAICQRNKLTENRESNYVDYKFFFNFY